jgi:glycosyltransferase involved in cell wall biosynthesis
MKIIFINRFFYPDHSATSQLLTELAFHLARQGHSVEVVCSRQLYEGAGARLLARDSAQGVEMHRAWSTTFGRAHLAGRLIDYVTFYLGAWLALRRLCDPQTIVVAKTDPPLISVLAAHVVRSRGGKLVNWLQDVFPEVGKHLGIKMLGGRIGNLIKRLRDHSLKAAACNVVLGERMAQLVQTCGIPADRICIIANWSDAEAIEAMPKAANPLIKEWGLTGKFVVMYSGNMGRAHEFETILDAATLLADRQDIQFLFVGGGAKRTAVQQAATARGLSSVLFKPYQPKEHLGNSLSTGDVHLISLLPELEGLIVPSKFYGVLAAGRPSLFIGDRDGELARLIRHHQIGRCFEIGQAQALATAIQEYADQIPDADSLGDEGRRARHLLLSEYQQSLALTRWEALLAGIRHDAP